MHVISRRSVLRGAALGAIGTGLSGVAVARGAGPAAAPAGAPLPAAAFVDPSLGPARRLSPDFFGFNGASLLKGPVTWRDPSFVRAVAGLRPATLRWPGGTVANYWDWERGWFVDGVDLPPHYAHLRVKVEPFDDFLAAARVAGAVPVFVLNLLHSDLGSQLRMLRHARRAGVPVRYVELGNEYYLSDHPAYVERFPDGAAYGAEATRWAEAVHAEFPRVEVAAVGCSHRKDQLGEARRAAWNEQVLSTLRGVQALTFHVYQGTGLPDGTELAAEHMPRLVTATFRRWTSVVDNDLPVLPAGMTAWLSEFGMFDRAVAYPGTWAHGLVVAAQALLTLEDRRVRMVDNHTLVGKAVFSAIFDDDKGFEYDGFTRPDAPPATAPLALTAAGTALRQVATALRGMTSARSLGFQAPAADGSRDQLGWLFNHGPRRAALVLNLSAQRRRLTTSGWFPGAARAHHVCGDPATRVTGPQSLTRTNGTVAAGQVELPAYSVTRLT
jgi:hypothetical protein